MCFEDIRSAWDLNRINLVIRNTQLVQRDQARIQSEPTRLVLCGSIYPRSMHHTVWALV